MAKSKSFFGLRSGSTKSHTYQVLNGQQITKDRVTSVHNPRTPRQNAQRIVFATVSQAMKFMGPIVNHSFEGVPYGGKSLNRFAKLNLERLRAYSALDYEEQATAATARCFMTTKSISALIPNKYIISTGSLTLSPNSANYVNGGAVYPFNPANDVAVDADATIGTVLSELFGISKAGQQITKCYILGAQGDNKFVYGGDATVPGNVITAAKFVAARLVVKQTADLSLSVSGMTTQQLQDALWAVFDKQKSDPALLEAIIVCVEVENSVASLATIDTVGDALGFLSGFIAAEATILSEFNGADALRSNAEMTLIAAPTAANNYGLTWDVANLAWSMGSAANADTERFLNEGGNGNQIGY